MAVEAFLMPGIERLATEVRCQRMRAANDLAFLHRQVGFRPALIAQDRIDLRAESEIEYFRHEIIRACRAGATAARWLFGFDDIADGLKRRIGAHVKDDRILRRRTDPVKFSQIELRFFAADELLDVDAVV